jgi:hypothetical protein
MPLHLLVCEEVTVNEIAKFVNTFESRQSMPHVDPALPVVIKPEHHLASDKLNVISNVRGGQFPD